MKGNDGVLLQQIAAALGTQEEGGNLVEVARNAHRAELKLASLERYAANLQWNKIKDHFGMPRGGT